MLNQERTFTASEAAVVSGVPVKTVHREIDEGPLKPERRRPGSKRALREHDLFYLAVAKGLDTRLVQLTSEGKDKLHDEILNGLAQWSLRIPRSGVASRAFAEPELVSMKLRVCSNRARAKRRFWRATHRSSASSLNSPKFSRRPTRARADHLAIRGTNRRGGKSRGARLSGEVSNRRMPAYQPHRCRKQRRPRGPSCDAARMVGVQGSSAPRSGSARRIRIRYQQRA